MEQKLLNGEINTKYKYKFRHIMWQIWFYMQFMSNVEEKKRL